MNIEQTSKYYSGKRSVKSVAICKYVHTRGEICPAWGGNKECSRIYVHMVGGEEDT
jgi:hypothetical protein